MKNTGKPIPVGIPTTPESKYRLTKMGELLTSAYKQENIEFISNWIPEEHVGTHVRFDDGNLYCSFIGDIAFPKPTTPLSTD